MIRALLVALAGQVAVGALVVICWRERVARHRLAARDREESRPPTEVA